MRTCSYALALAAARALLAPGRPVRTLAIRAAPLDAAAEFSVKVGLVDALRGVEYGEHDVVSAGLVAEVAVARDRLTVGLETPDKLDPLELEALCRSVEAAAGACVDALVAEGSLDEGCGVFVGKVNPSPPPPPPPPAKDPFSSDGFDGSLDDARGDESLRRVKRVVAVASGKGGVGKSTVSANLALALRDRGLKVGLCDADVHGPSLPDLLGLADDPTIRLAAEIGPDGKELLEPFVAHGLKLMSFGYLSDKPAFMRGSRLSGVVQQLAASVAWRDLDVLLVDCPPGTGDAQLTLCQVLDLDAAVVVTTPSRLAFVDVVKGVALFDEVDVPVAAVVENMGDVSRPGAAADAAAFAAAHGLDAAAEAALAALLAEPTPLFGPSSARRLREMWGLDSVFRLPLLADRQFAPLALRDAAAADATAARCRDEIARLAEDVARRLEAPAVAPPAVAFEDGSFRVAYDGRTTLVAPFAMRRLCRCATCVDDATGVARDPPPLPPDLRPLTLGRAGNYALAVGWSDGHQSLLPFRAFVPGYSAAKAGLRRDRGRMPQGVS